MSKLRPLQTGYLYRRGETWFLCWREDVRDPASGEIIRKRFTKRVSPARTPEGREIGKREAERIAWETILEPLNRAAVHLGTLATVREVWSQRFMPEYVATLKAAGRKHYAWAEAHILARLGALTMREVSRQHLKDFLRAVESEGYQRTVPGKEGRAATGPRRDYSRQTLTHLRNALSRFFRFATEEGFFQGANPARQLATRGEEARPRRVLTFEEAHKLLAALPEPTASAAYLSMVCSLNVAELAGLQRRHVNLGSEPVMLADGDILPPLSLAVRANYYAGERATPKTRARRRIVPLTPGLADRLAALMRAQADQSADALVFGNRHGRALDYRTAARRHIKATAARVLGHTDVSWHSFRHAAATYADWVQMPVAERVALMGHTRAAMTLHYTHSDIDRRRPYLAAVEQLLFPPSRDGETATTEPQEQKT